MEKINHWYETYGFLGTLLAAITPIPYKVFTIASGVFSYPFGSFVLASVIGRSFRFFVVATLLYYYGPPIKTWMEKYFDRCAWAFLILLVLGFVALKWL